MKKKKLHSLHLFNTRSNKTEFNLKRFIYYTSVMLHNRLHTNAHAHHTHMLNAYHTLRHSSGLRGVRCSFIRFFVFLSIDLYSNRNGKLKHSTCLVVSISDLRLCNNHQMRKAHKLINSCKQLCYTDINIHTRSERQRARWIRNTYSYGSMRCATRVSAPFFSFRFYTYIVIIYLFLNLQLHGA